MGALKQTVRLISQNLGPVSSALYKAANLYTKSYNNINHDMRTNGEFHVLDRLSALRVKTVFDVGANRGDYTRACLARFAEADIHAFEIVPETYEKFIRNIRSERVIANNFGLSDHAGTIDINYNPKKDGLSSLIEGTEINRGDWAKRTVKISTGDEYCSERGIGSIDFLKMDVEGAENLVLGGFSNMLSGGNISAMQFEYGMINIYTKFLLIDFWKLLSGYGFVLGPMMPRGVAFKTYDPRDETFQGPPNFLAVHASRTDMVEAVRVRT